MPKKLTHRGDTIVEVLIAMAVVSTVLAGAYTSTRGSASATRAAQEHGEALKLAESQIEQIRIAVENNTDVKDNGDFCMVAGAPPVARCDNIGSGQLYDVEVFHQQTSSDFLVHVTWDGLGGNLNRVELGYKTQ